MLKVTVEKDSNGMPNTGDKNLILVVAVILITTAATAGIAFYRRKKLLKTDEIDSK